MTEPPAVTVIVPMPPPSALLPNQRYRRGGLYPGIDAAAQCRTVAKLAAVNGGKITTITGPVELTLHIAYGYKRVTPDLDGSISACKAFCDGIVDAGILVDDSQIVRIIATHEKLKSSRKNRADGFTRLTFRPAPDTTSRP